MRYGNFQRDCKVIFGINAYEVRAMPSAAKAHILLVEDERGISSAFALLLKIEGFRVSVAGDGQAALDQLRETSPDLILTDLRMPVMNGLELIQKVRAEPAHANLPILLMSGALPEGLYPTPFGGADAFLQMPAGVAELLNVIERLLKEHAETAWPQPDLVGRELSR